MWLGTRYAPTIRWIAPPWNQFGWILIALGLALDLYSILIFIRTRTTVNPLRPGNATQLVVSGVYRISRNPMYLGMVLSLTGWVWLLGSPLCLLLVLLFARILVIVQIAPEEIALQDLFGTSYGDYCKQVNRWIGRKSRSTEPPAK
jgi:protein-S-isoprenylcysteine O-methyltransferase Ste14